MGRERTASAERVALGKRISAARRRAGLKQADAARALGVSVQSFQQWEAGRTSPRGSRLAQLASVLGVSIAELLGEGVRVDLAQRSATDRVFWETYLQLPARHQAHIRELVEFLYSLTDPRKNR
jgi:transcriptional regulator with XRE-family HTH domain